MMTRSRALAVIAMPTAFGIVLIAADDVRVRAQEPATAKMVQQPACRVW